MAHLSGIVVAVLLSSPLFAQPATSELAHRYQCHAGFTNNKLRDWRAEKLGPDAVRDFNIDPTLLNFHRRSIDGKTVDAAVMILRQISFDEENRFYGNFAVTGGSVVIDLFANIAGKRSKLVYRSGSPHGMGASNLSYGVKQGRYVDRNRLEQMLNGEWLDILSAKTGPDLQPQEPTTLFAQAATIVTGEHGSAWQGMRFQRPSDAQPSTLILHVKFSGTDSYEQQQSLARLQANMLHLIYKNLATAEEAIKILTYAIGQGIGDLNYFELHGSLHDKYSIDDLSRALLAQDETDILAFGSDGRMLNLSEEFYQKNLVLIPVDIPYSGDSDRLNTALRTAQNSFRDHIPVIEIIVENDGLFVDGSQNKWSESVQKILEFCRDNNVACTLANPSSAYSMQALWSLRDTNLSRRLGNLKSLKIINLSDQSIEPIF